MGIIFNNIYESENGNKVYLMHKIEKNLGNSIYYYIKN